MRPLLGFSAAIIARKQQLHIYRKTNEGIEIRAALDGGELP